MATMGKLPKRKGTVKNPILRLIPALLLGAQLAASAAPEPEVGGREPIKAFCIDFNWGEGGPNGFAKPGLWAGADPGEHVAWYGGLGCNVIQTFAVSCNGYAWYQGGRVPPQPGLQHNFLADMVRLGHARGLRVMGYYCVGANTRWGLLHPDLSYEIPSAPHIPFTTEYLDFLCASITEAIQLTGLDGFMIDWVWNPGDLDGQPLRWLPCEQKMYRELLGADFPGREKISKDQELRFRRLAIDRCWERLRAATKQAKPGCVLWLSCCDVNSPVVAGSKLFREVDWLMNEATDPAVLARLERMKGAHTRLLQCVVGWGDSHDARKILQGGDRPFGVYGFAKPSPNSLPRPVAEYRQKPVTEFQGNDRNIAVLARFFTGASLEIVVDQEPDGSLRLAPASANTVGNSPVVMEGQIGHWGNPQDSVNWQFNLRQPGRFTILLEYAVERSLGGSSLVIKAGAAEFPLVAEETGSWRTYKTFTVGQVELAQAGRQTLAVIPGAQTPWKAISLKSVTLTPVK